MSADAPTPEEWQRIIEAVSGRPTVNQLAETITRSDRYPIEDISEAADLVETALDTGVLHEDDEASGMFQTVRVAGRDPPDQVEESVDGHDASNAATDAKDIALNALEDAIAFFHSRVDDPLPDSCTINADTPREYFHQRGWADETIEQYQLGYAPASDTALLDHLMRQGYDRHAILGTGLFWERGLAPIWKGRAVLPYLVEDQPAFAISRRLGHPDDDAGKYADDDDAAKYHKIPGQDCAAVTEPIFGLDSIEPGEPLLITEGIADAITAQEAGYPTVSPVTTRFKHDDREALVAALNEYEIPRIYIVQDAERASSDLADDVEGWDALSIEQFGEGLRGAVDTGAYLAAHDIEAYVAELPLPARSHDFHKVDLDDYLQEWADGDLSAILASAKPTTEHQAYDPKEIALDRAYRDTDRQTIQSENGSALYALSILDVTGLDKSYRGPNPLGHHGDSENYYTFYERGGDYLGFDHKYKVSYNGLTHLLVEAGERSADDPYGRLDDGEHFAAWREAKHQGVIAPDDSVPYRAICHVVRDHELAPQESIPGAGDTDASLPADAYNEALAVINEEYGLDPGREPVRGAQGHAHEYEVDPLTLDVVIDVALAHRAVQNCLPHDLDAEVSALEGVETVENEGWAPADAPNTRTNIVRATLLSENLISSWDADLDADIWTQGYRIARERYGAPLPEYVNHTVATDRWATIEGAVEALRSWHIRDGMADYLTVEDPSGADTIAVYDFEDSESGERLVEFASGLYYCRQHEHVVDPLRAVAVQEEIIADCEAIFAGDDFRDAYHAARETYGAPLPEWRVGDPSHTVLLPPASDVLGELAVDADELAAAREQHEDLLEAMAKNYRTTHLDTSSPGTGKTTGTVKIAAQRDQPVLYAAPRLELMKEVEETAQEYGGSYYHAPIFAKAKPAGGAITRGVQAIRESDQGFELLREPEALLEYLEIEPEDVEPHGGAMGCGECGEESDSLTAARLHECPLNAQEKITLKNPDGSTRASCPTATGPTSGDPDDDDYVWWLRVHIARALGFTPKEIHIYDEWLFDEELPCQHTDEDEDDLVEECALSRAWERIADPDRPIDVLIGHYVHAHVESARTYYYRSEDESTATQPRAVAIDEFPSDAYGVEFGDEAVEHARWLAQSLRADISSTQDMWEADPALGEDDHVAAWLDGEAANPDRWEEAASLADVLDELLELVEALDTIQGITDVHGERLTKNHPDLGAALRAVGRGVGLVEDTPFVERIGTLRRALHSAHLDKDRHRGLDQAVSSIGGVLGVLGVTEADDTPTTLEDALAERPAPFHGDLADLIERTITAVLKNEVGTVGLLWSAKKAAAGGEDGCRELAAHARDGYAHPLSVYLLAGAVREGEIVETPSFTFGLEDGETGEGEVLSQVDLGRATVLWSRDHNGALVNHPPSFTAGGMDCSVIGLDATGRESLWELALGRRVTTESIHDDVDDKRRFLRDVMNLQVVQTSRRLQTYEGTPSGSFDGDVGVVREVSREYTKQFLRQGRLDQATKPGVITTKTVRQRIEARITDDVSAIDHYGNILGSNELARCNLGIVLGTQHYGDAVVEKWAALGGQEVARSGHGNDLSYGCAIGDTFLKHMTEDQTLQAIMRFGRDEAGAIVFAHTSALRDDLPVVGSGAVVRSYSRTGHAVAKTLKALRDQEFTRADVEEHLEADVSSRQVRRVLEEFVEAGFLKRDDRVGPRGAHQFEVDHLPDGPVNTLLPTPAPDVPESTDEQPVGRPSRVTYTVDVRLDLGGDIREQRSQTVRTMIAAPAGPIEPAPPGSSG